MNFISSIINPGTDISLYKSDFQKTPFQFELDKSSPKYDPSPELVAPFIDFFKEKGKDLDLINMGVLGGTQENVEIFLDFFTKIRSSSNTELNINMAIGQFIFRFIFQGNNICVGKPLTSEYKKYQKDRKDVFFIHK